MASRRSLWDCVRAGQVEAVRRVAPPAGQDSTGIGAPIERHVSSADREGQSRRAGATRATQRPSDTHDLRGLHCTCTCTGRLYVLFSSTLQAGSVQPRANAERSKTTTNKPSSNIYPPTFCRVRPGPPLYWTALYPVHPSWTHPREGRSLPHAKMPSQLSVLHARAWNGMVPKIGQNESSSARCAFGPRHPRPRTPRSPPWMT